VFVVNALKGSDVVVIEFDGSVDAAEERTHRGKPPCLQMGQRRVDVS
jgi:hypothetical protein